MICKGGGGCRAITLTTSPDNVVGTSGNDIVNGYINTTTATVGQSTFSAADVVNGGAGTDTFNLTVEGANAAGSIPAASISGIEKFFIRDVNASGASTYDFSALDGETEVWADRSTQVVTFDKLGTGTVVGVKGNGVVANANVTFDMAKATDAVSIALDSVKNGAAGADTVIATANGQATAATITASGAASDVDQIELSKAGSHTVKDVAINANANLTIGTADGTADLIGFDVGATVTNTITVTGTASSVKLNDVAGAVDAIDASAFAGGVTADASLATLASFKGGKGNDTLTVAALTATGTVDLGAGDDVFKAAAGVVKSTNSIDGGAGTDAFGLTAIDAGNLAKFSNFEVVALDGLASGNYDLSLLAAKNTITGLTIDVAVTGGTVDKVAAGVGVKVVGDSGSSGLTIKVKDAATGTTDSFGVEFAVPTSTPAGTAQTPSLDFTLDEVETVNIVSGGGADTTNTLTVRTSAVTQASATNKVTLTYNVSGANDLTLDASNSAVANTKLVIDGSTATGKLDITGSTTTTVIKGGSAVDTFTLANGASVTVTGNGGKDKVDVSAVAYDTTAKDITTFTDATAGDTIQTVGTGATAGTKLGAATDLAGATDLATILETLADAADVAATDAAWAVVGTDVYLVVSDQASTGTAAEIVGDNVIKLTGVSDLANWTVNASGLITVV